MEPERCPACGGPLCQVAQEEGLGLSPEDRYYKVVDQTWRHSDGSVAIAPDGTLKCSRTGEG